MACNIEHRLRDTIKDEIVKNATSYRIEFTNTNSPKSIFIPFSKNSSIKTLEASYRIALDKVSKINKKYNPWSKGDVVSINSTYNSGTLINIHPTQALKDAYEIEEDRKSSGYISKNEGEDPNMVDNGEIQYSKKDVIDKLFQDINQGEYKNMFEDSKELEEFFNKAVNTSQEEVYELKIQCRI